MDRNTRKQKTSKRVLPGAAAAGAAAALVENSCVARSAHVSGGELIKIALVGCGGRGTGATVQAMHTNGPVKLWAMADAFEDQIQRSLKLMTSGANVSRGSAKGLESKIDVPRERRFVGLNAYQQAIDSGADVIILATPPGFRPLQFEYAVRQGKHVFMEKPVAVDSPGVRRVLAAAKDADRQGLKVGVGLHRRHDPIYRRTIDRVHNGAIGALAYLCAYSNRTGVAKYVQRQPQMTEMEYQVAHWYYFTWLSGDFIVEQSVHMLDVCNWAKQGCPVKAQGQGGRQVRTGNDYGHIYDHHAVEYAYKDGVKLFSQNRHIRGCWNEISERAYGDAGSAHIGLGEIEGRSPWSWRGQAANPYQLEHDALFDAIRNDKPHNEAEYGALSTLTAVMGRMATYSGQVVSWEEAFNSDLDLSPERYAWDAAPPVAPDQDGNYPVATPGVTKAW